MQFHIDPVQLHGHWFHAHSELEGPDKDTLEHPGVVFVIDAKAVGAREILWLVHGSSMLAAARAVGFKAPAQCKAPAWLVATIDSEQERERVARALTQGRFIDL